MTLFTSTSGTDAQIREIYESYKSEILKLSEAGDAEACMAKVFDVWIFMNRLRNCDLRFYFDEDLHTAITRLNPRRFDLSSRLKKKSEYRIAFILGSTVDTGGASIPRRFMLEQYPEDGISFKQYVLVSNITSRSDHKDTETYRYITEEMPLAGFEHLPPGMGWLEKGKYIEQWLYDNEIDFVVAAVCPAMIYAYASQPAAISAVLNQDCYTFTVGPGVGDYTFLVTTDQAFKYKFSGEDPEKRMKVIMLPLHSTEYISETEPMDRAELGVPEDAVVSGSSNMWKTCFGDSEVLLEGIATLIRKHPNYHHVFVGTPRCLDNVDVFLSRNPEIRDNVHFIGTEKNIYRFLKAIDFWVNSFPTSGGSDIECAMIGKPTIELLANRNLNLHGAEFLRSHECDVFSMDEFVALGTRFITDPDYRDDLGAFLQQKISREFDKNRIAKDRIYDFFVDEYNKRLAAPPPLPGLEIDSAIEYEKRIALFNGFGRDNWPQDKKRRFLDDCRSDFPNRPFAWIKCLEEAIDSDDRNRFENITASLQEPLISDHRTLVLMALGWEKFGDHDKAVSHAALAVSQSQYDDLPAQILDQLSSGSAPDITLPIYYDY